MWSGSSKEQQSRSYNGGVGRHLGILLCAAFLVSSSCAQVDQFFQLNHTITLGPQAVGDAAVFLANTAAVSLFASITRAHFQERLIAQQGTVNPLFLAAPEILEMQVLGAVDSQILQNPMTNQNAPAIDIDLTTVMRVEVAEPLTDLQFNVNVEFSPYWALGAGFLDYIGDLRGSSITLFDNMSLFSQDFGIPQDIGDPTATPPPVAPPTPPPVAPPTATPVAPPTRAPVNVGVTPAPIGDTCLGFGQTCASFDDCCSARCIFSKCQRPRVTTTKTGLASGRGGAAGRIKDTTSNRNGLGRRGIRG